MFFARRKSTGMSGRNGTKGRSALIAAARPCIDQLEGRTLLSFTAPVSYTTGTGAGAVTVADFNGDAKLDMAVANIANASTVTVLMGNGDGTFQPGSVYAAGVAASDITSGD